MANASVDFMAPLKVENWPERLGKRLISDILLFVLQLSYQPALSI